MSLLKHLDTEDQEPVNQFGHFLNKRENGFKQGPDFFFLGGGGGKGGRVTQTAKMSE